jgi:hypothetical protein
MRLSANDARARLAGHTHGVFCTLHAVRGPDPVPVVYAVSDNGHVGVPVDRVKAKTSTRLQRETNLAVDPRASLLVEHWDAADWTRLWWVRAALRHVPAPEASVADDLADRLARTVPQYADRPFHHVLVCRIETVSGWSAANRDGRND